MHPLLWRQAIVPEGILILAAQEMERVAGKARDRYALLSITSPIANSNSAEAHVLSK